MDPILAAIIGLTLLFGSVTKGTNVDHKVSDEVRREAYMQIEKDR